MSESPQFFFRQIHPNRWKAKPNKKFRLTSDIFTDDNNAVSLSPAAETTPQKVMAAYTRKSVGLAVISDSDLTISRDGKVITIAKITVDSKSHATLSYPIEVSSREMERRSEILRNAASKRGLLLFCYDEPLQVFPPCMEGEGKPFDPTIKYAGLE